MLVATDRTVSGSDALFMAILRAIIGDTQGSLVDLCSHNARLTRHLDFTSRTYIDVLPRELGDEQNAFVQCDVLGSHEVLERHYNVATCLDGIEHLKKDDGFKLLTRMERISDKQVLFTPLDPWCIDMQSEHPESHRSVWGPSDVPGYASLLMPKYHEILRIGAFFFWKCRDLETEFPRVVKELNASGLAHFSE